MKDHDLIEAFQAKYSTFVDERSALTVLQSIAEKGWHEDDLRFLATVGTEEYYGNFKTHQGKELQKLIKTCLQFGTMAGSPEMTQIHARASEALAQIGGETKLNALRAQMYGVTITRDAPGT